MCDATVSSVDEQDIMSRTGHRSEAAVRKYGISVQILYYGKKFQKCWIRQRLKKIEDAPIPAMKQEPLKKQL
jgi:hypothetical protein